MGSNEGNNFAKKHNGNIELDPAVKEEVLKRSKEGKLSCAVAFEIVKKLGVTAGEVGKTGDLLNLRLMKCQLGLFGYTPEKKIIKPQDTENQDLKDAITNALVNERLSCKSAWNIASDFKIRKMTISSFAEGMGIKIKPCQLGAF